MTALTRAYGLTLRSELPLRLERPAAEHSAIDLEIQLGAPTFRREDPPPGRILLHLQASRQFYTGTIADDAYHLRFYGTCDIVLDRGLRRATVHLVDGADPTVVEVLASGTLLAFVLALRGEAVLHASAVQLGDVALAFVGASGMGKSTMATLLCAAGARLITDDLLRLDLTASPPRCALGAAEVRLRKGAGDLAARFAEPPQRRTTGDARDALSVPPTSTEGVPLATIVVPAPVHSPEFRDVSIERLDPKAAFLLLSRFPRLLGWRDEEVLRRQFQQLGEIIDAVPVHVAGLPWGPPFSDGLAEEVARGVGILPTSVGPASSQDGGAEWPAVDSTDVK